MSHFQTFRHITVQTNPIFKAFLLIKENSKLDLIIQFCFNPTAPTYETATTRKYRQGRTETLRSCSNEAVAFIRQMDKTETDISTKRQLLKTALVHICFIF